MPQISVIIPVFNSEKFIEKAIKSILNQNFTDFEIIIICDPSEDHTKKIIESCKDTRIKIIYNKEKIGLIKSLNLGLSLSLGKYIARMDADDISHPERFDKQLAFLEKNPDVGVLGTWIEFIDEDENVTGFFNPSPSPILVEWNMLFYCDIVHPSVMIKKECFEKVGYYSDDAKYCEDYDLWFRIIDYFKITNLPERLLQLRKHEKNVSKMHYQAQITQSIALAHKRSEKILKMRIPEETIKIIRTPGYVTKSHYIIKSGNLLYQLYKHFVSKKDIGKADKEYIRQNTAEKFHDLAINYFRQNPIYSIVFYAYIFRVSRQRFVEWVLSDNKSIIIYIKKVIK